MTKDEEIIYGLQRVEATFQIRIDLKSLEALRNVINHYKSFGALDDLHKSIAKDLIEKANRKEIF